MVFIYDYGPGIADVCCIPISLCVHLSFLLVISFHKFIIVLSLCCICIFSIVLSILEMFLIDVCL